MQVRFIKKLTSIFTHRLPCYSEHAKRTTVVSHSKIGSVINDYVYFCVCALCVILLLVLLLLLLLPTGYYFSSGQELSDIVNIGCRCKDFFYPFLLALTKRDHNLHPLQSRRVAMASDPHGSRIRLVFDVKQSIKENVIAITFLIFTQFRNERIEARCFFLQRKVSQMTRANGCYTLFMRYIV